MNQQEQFWSGPFGDQYASRNDDKYLLASNLHFWSNVIKHTLDVKWVLELGANVGMNLHALKLLRPDAQFTAVEINESACNQLRQTMPECTVEHMSIKDWITYDVDREANEEAPEDLIICSGVLIHQNPNDLPMIYDYLATSGKYVLINEYYSPNPVDVLYRGQPGVLFKRDFAGEFLEKHPEFDVEAYGFCSKHDPNFPKDDTNWFLLRRLDK